MDKEDRNEEASSGGDRMEWLRKRVWDVLIVVLILFIVETLFWGKGPGIDKGQAVPELSFRPLDGGKVVIGKGEGPALVVFWATWCPACRRELPSIQRIYRAYRDTGLKVLALTDEVGDETRVKAFLREKSYSFPVAIERGNARRAFGINTIPTVYVVDGQGKVAWYNVGVTDEEDLAARLRAEKYADDAFTRRL